MRLGDRLGGLARARLRTRLDRGDVLGRKSLCQCPCLTQTERAQLNLRVSPYKDAIDHLMRRMPDEVDHHSHGRPVLPAPSLMKLIVRARASLSVNCCGGDFMK